MWFEILRETIPNEDAGSTRVVYPNEMDDGKSGCEIGTIEFRESEMSRVGELFEESSSLSLSSSHRLFVSLDLS